MVFFGEYLVSFSAPGRIILPKKLRELLKGNIFILTKGFDFCLAGYDKEDWEARASELLTVSLLEQDNLEKRRFLFSSAVYLEIDDQGRFVIPRNLINYATITEKVLIVGVGDHFEIWQQSKWEKYAKGNKN
ncbi:division/cell wall cluster transcriptional repressor MraZ [Candidatus Roizmanbacteria bacterium CG09_land_8_20_14_0_10_41_9]|uniref:Transcriptional regulator MraZ n=1 Tax=Candidatus Roizmanbacteria bacterium CG09_land_8_20_14_0_10_41_9 TaxID=1974850 RepID=A0A2H0WSD8_9BACT|nr:MAG: division/cell wall cluster transcriptional repressor MraZ [Candidatus Roizmanbacteria bacterium CG09_land_8_20_14_0_10_41_9]